MLKRTLTYTDFNGVERTETFYFNLTKAELTEMEISESGGYAEMLRSIIDSKDVASLVRIFKDLVLKAYGEKSPDGRHFMKSEAISNNFANTQAYSDIFMALATDTQAAIDFVNGIIPQDIDRKQLSEANSNVVNLPTN